MTLQYILGPTVANDDSDQGDSTSINPRLIIKIIIFRRWLIYIWRSFVVILAIDILGLCSFAIEDATERLHFCLALLLAMIFAIESNLNLPFLTFLGRYSLAGFLFIFILIIYATFFEVMTDYDDNFDDDWFGIDSIFCFIYAFILFMLQCGFGYYGYKIRHYERERCFYDIDKTDNYILQNAPPFSIEYTDRISSGDSGRLAIFWGSTKEKKHTLFNKNLYKRVAEKSIGGGDNDKEDGDSDDSANVQG